MARWTQLTMWRAGSDSSFAVVVRFSFEAFIWPVAFWHVALAKNTSSLLAPTIFSYTAQLARATSKISANLCQ